MGSRDLWFDNLVYMAYNMPRFALAISLSPLQIETFLGMDKNGSDTAMDRMTLG